MKKPNKLLNFFIIFIFFISFLTFPQKLFSFEESYLSIFEILFPDFLSLIEESGGFSLIDFQAVSVYDNSFLITKWFLNSFEISNPLIPGSSLFLPLINFINFVNINNENVFFNYNFNMKSFIKFSYIAGYNNFDLIIGPPLYEFIRSFNIKNFFLGSHPLLRENLPYNNRRHIKYNISINLFFNLNDFLIKNSLNNDSNYNGDFINLYFLNGKRSFNSFYYDPNKNLSYYEDYFAFQIIHSFNFFKSIIYGENVGSDYNMPIFIYEFRSLSNFKNVYGFQYEQTLALSYFIFGIFYSENKLKNNLILREENFKNEKYNYKNYYDYDLNFISLINNLFYNDFVNIREDFSYSLYFIRSEFSHINPIFSFDLVDPDGEGLFPIFFEGNFNVLGCNFSNINLTKEKLIKLTSRNNLFIYSPHNLLYENKIFFQGSEYGKVVTNYCEQIFYNSIDELFLNFKYNIKDYILLFNTGIGFNIYLNNTLKNTLFLTSPFFELKFYRENKGQKILPYINLYKQNVYLNFEYIKFLNPDLIKIYLYYKNGNNYELINNFDAYFVSIDEKIKLPSIWGSLLGVDFILSNNFKINLEFNGKIILNKFIISFDGDINNYMYSENIDGNLVYFYKSGEKYYLLKNYNNKNLDYSLSGKLELLYFIKNKFFLITSFKAHQVLGITTFGNGFYNNDLLSLDYSFANPNTYTSYIDKTSYGRTDNDRAYIFNFLLGYNLLDFCWIVLSIKYKDGQPFSVYRILQSSTGQLAYFYDTIQAENVYGLKGGPREDSLWRIDLTLNFMNILTISIYNILDIGNEFGENQFNLNYDRSALELNYPLTILVKINFNF